MSKSSASAAGLHKSAHKKSVRTKLIIAVGLILLIILLRYSGIGNYISLKMFKLYREALIQFVSAHYFFSVFVYIVILAGATFLSIPITVLLNLIAGFLFGIAQGILYVNIGTVMGAACSFLVFRYLLGDIVREKYAHKLKEFNAHIQQYGYSYLLSLQFFPATPLFLINTLSGLTAIKLWTFIWTTSVGILPGSLIYTYLGQQLGTIEAVKDIFSWNIIVLLIVLGFFALLLFFLNNKCYTR